MVDHNSSFWFNVHSYYETFLSNFSSDDVEVEIGGVDGSACKD